MSQMLATFIDLLDAGALVSPNANADERNQALMNFLRARQGDGYPVSQTTEVVFGARDDADGPSQFRVWLHRFEPKQSLTGNRPNALATGNWIESKLAIPDSTDFIHISGSGSKALSDHIVRLAREYGRTSRTVFWSLCDLITMKLDPGTGGVPQLAAIYNAGPAKPLGVAFSGQRYIYGTPVPPGSRLDLIEWRDELFQRIAPDTLKPLQGAQIHRRNPR